jgi:hypothetical protein
LRDASVFIAVDACSRRILANGRETAFKLEIFREILQPKHGFRMTEPTSHNRFKK